MHNVITCMLAQSPRMNKEIVQDETLTRLTGRNFPALKKATEGKVDRHPMKVCRVCCARGIRTAKGGRPKTVHICKTCPTNPGLHVDVCFEAFHTLLDYSK